MSASSPRASRRRATTVHVVTRGRAADPAPEDRAGVLVHRVARSRDAAAPRRLPALGRRAERAHGRGGRGARHGRSTSCTATTGSSPPPRRPRAARRRRPLRDRSTRPSTAATTAGSRSTRSRTSTPPSVDGPPRRPVIVCSHYMRGHVADVFGVDEDAVTVIPNGIDPLDLRPVDDLATLRAGHAAPDERLVLLTGRLVHEKGFQLALEALPGVIRRVGRVRFLVAGAGPYEAELGPRPRASALTRTGRSSAGSATTCCTRSTGSPTSASSPRSTSRSGSSRSRRWRAAARASWPTPAACARSSPTTTSGCASARATRAPWRRR